MKFAKRLDTVPPYLFVEISRKIAAKKAEGIKDYWKEKFEEAYEYTMPQRESFFEETPGSRRTDKIFDETAVVRIQEFASRLQAGMTPSFA